MFTWANTELMRRRTRCKDNASSQIVSVDSMRVTLDGDAEDKATNATLYLLSLTMTRPSDDEADLSKYKAQFMNEEDEKITLSASIPPRPS